ncbi:MAG: TatD family hydrolase [Kiritimatiellaeota bacterium]|nr:TatD family hydrolase [Kiritimatiellota bacterium]
MDTPLQLVDTHVHFDAYRETGELAAVLERAAAAGVQRMIAMGGAEDGNAFALELAAAHPERIRAAVGFDRHLAGQAPDFARLAEQAARPGVAAIGECGLDYHYSPETAAAQRALFARMLALARDRRLPVVVHSREAEDDTLALLKEHAAAWAGDPARLGVLHCFTGGADFARRVLASGLWVSFSGILTFRNADAIRAAARIVPADRLLVETDAPYLAPEPHRGHKNEPALVADVARALAATRGEPVERVAEQTARNAAHLFGWPT